MSPVLNVVLFGSDDSGHKFHLQAVLKLYDRRFGERLRRYRGEHVPHTMERELAFQSFVRRGMMNRFLGRQEEDFEAEDGQNQRGKFEKTEKPISLQYDLEPDAEFEAAVWEECERNFNCETQAYERLKDLQGKLIPRMYAHVRLLSPIPNVPHDLLDSSDTARYFEVKGVILQRVAGYPLYDLPTSPQAPSDMGLWPDIVQAAVDAVHMIDRRGVLNTNCAPYNIVVDSHSHTPFIIDFASCRFKERLIQQWRDNGRMGDDDDPEIEYWEEVVTVNNEGAIGVAMAARLRQMKGLELSIRYPNSQKILEDMKRSKGIESAKDRAGTSGWKILYS
ncbi:hypothetical protein CHGG_10398 [Chaetomium globosum CBS 148.51]|uniref:Protein kinase domain-containing protein n=1 Tax=Chaetomium globosum (strain ATCC 6205 / CBS 148.51 / DSM 1962 / NBRC 6347 / NRRL 1970) TaxID=306901 RepID=Q2GNQ6_CHAGB|nr:uncharacterized protein CHGG_10398 [Chaetomium globosum CBS 148.51]EAQ83994.1 hypothetical protein CHGG_10398 [Chaetomium globosum CBS 148.51]